MECLVLSCHHNHESAEFGIFLHRLDMLKHLSWLKEFNKGRKELLSPCSNYICSAHFQEDDFAIYYEDEIDLKESAKPSLFLHPLDSPDCEWSEEEAEHLRNRKSKCSVDYEDEDSEFEDECDMERARYFLQLLRTVQTLPQFKRYELMLKIKQMMEDAEPMFYGGKYKYEAEYFSTCKSL